MEVAIMRPYDIVIGDGRHMANILRTKLITTVGVTRKLLTSSVLFLQQEV